MYPPLYILNQIHKLHTPQKKILKYLNHQQWYILFQIEFQFAESVNDLQLVGGQFIQNGGRSLCVSGYDSPEIHIFTLS